MKHLINVLLIAINIYVIIQFIFIYDYYKAIAIVFDFKI